MQGFLGLEDHELWTDPLRRRDEVTERLGRESFEGILLDGPASVSLGEHDTLPLAGVRRCSLDEGARLGLDAMGLLTTVHLESNEVHVTSLFPDKTPAGPGRAPVGLPPGFGPPSQGFSTRLFLADPTEQIPALARRTGTLLSTVILLDQRSNRVRTKVSWPVAEDPAVAEFLEQQRRPDYPRPVWPRARSPHPRYRSIAEAPPAPAGPSIDLRAERVVVLSRSPRCMLRGSFRLPVLPREIVRPRPPVSPAGPSRWQNVGDREATAVLPITLLLTSKEAIGPYVYRLQVPVHERLDEGADRPEVTGCFELDLFDLPEAPRIPGTYAVWLLSGEVLSGPYKIALIPEELLPRPGE